MRAFAPLPRSFGMAQFRRHPLIAAAAMIIAAAAVSLMAGCSATDKLAAPPPSTDFQATVSGAIQAPLSGSAVLFALPATTVDSTNVPATNILGMADAKSPTVLAFKWQNTATVAAGTYTVGSDTSLVGMMYDEGTGAAGSTFDGTAGTVTVTTATAQTVTGSYQVTATAEDTGAQITVTGTFSAPIKSGPAN